MYCSRYTNNRKELHWPEHTFNIYVTCTCVDFLLEVIGHSRRSYNLRWNHDDTFFQNVDNLAAKEAATKQQALLVKSQSVTLPALRCLTIRSNWCKKPDDGNLTSLYSKFPMPNLFKLDADYNVVSLHQSFIGKPRSISLHIHGCGRTSPLEQLPRDTFDMDDLFSFFQSSALTEVESMHLRITSMHGQRTTAMDSLTSQHVQYEQLRSLSLDIGDMWSAASVKDYFEHILKYLHGPNIETVLVIIHCKRDFNVVHLLLEWLASECHRHLKSILLAIRCSDDWSKGRTEYVLASFLRLPTKLRQLPQWVQLSVKFSINDDKHETYEDKGDYSAIDWPSLAPLPSDSAQRE